MNATEDVSETWLPVPGYEGFYEVSDLGSVRSVERVVRAARGGVQKNERNAIAELRWIHKRCNHDHEICDTCDGCEYPWPCRTIAILDKWGV